MLLKPLIVVPTFNNPRSLEGVIEALLRNTEFSILIVDDGSSPPVQLQSSNERVHQIRFEENQGKGAALRSGFSWALENQFTHVISFDADGQHLSESVSELWRAARENPFALVLGVRDLSAKTVPEISRFGRKFSNFWLWVQTGVRVRDSQTGLRVYPLFELQKIKWRCRKFDFEIEVLVRLLSRAVDVIECDVPVLYQEGEDRVSHFDKLWDNARISMWNAVYVVASPYFRIRRWRRKKRDQRLYQRLWAGTIRGGRIGNEILKLLLKIFGLRICSIVLFFLVPYFFIFAPKARKSSFDFWRVMAPAHSTLWVSIQIYRQFFTYGRLLLEKVYSSIDRIPYEGTSENYHQICDRPDGVLVLGAHVGAWMMAGNYVADHGLSKELFVFEYEADGMSLNKLTKDYEPPSVRRKISNQMEFSILEMKDLLRDGHPIAILADRVSSQRLELVKFFGRLTPVDSFPFRLAVTMQKPVVISFGFKRNDGSYRFLAESLYEPGNDGGSFKKEELIRSLCMQYMNRLEYWVRQYPQQWFNFYPYWELPASLKQAQGRSSSFSDHRLSLKKSA